MPDAVLHAQNLTKRYGGVTALTTAEMKPDADFFPKLPGSFVTNISIPQCEVHIPVTDVVK